MSTRGQGVGGAVGGWEVGRGGRGQHFRKVHDVVWSFLILVEKEGDEVRPGDGGAPGLFEGHGIVWHCKACGEVEGGHGLR